MPALPPEYRRAHDATQGDELAFDGRPEATVHNVVARGVEGGVGVTEPQRVRVQVKQEVTVRGELLRPQEVDDDPEAVDGQP